MARVTGAGLVFFESRGDNAALAAWYQEHRTRKVPPGSERRPQADGWAVGSEIS